MKEKNELTFIETFLIWWYKKPFLCRIGMHQDYNSDRKSILKGTGKFIKGEEIKEKVYYWEHKCSDCGYYDQERIW